MYSNSTFYAQNPALEIVDQQEERLSTHTCTKGMFSRLNPLCAASCVTKNISPRFSPTVFYRDANSGLLRAHLCTAVSKALCAEPCVLNCSLGEREGLCTHMYNGNIQKNSLCVESCVTVSHLSPFLACVFSSRGNFTTLTSTSLYSSRLYAQKTLCLKVFKRA